MELSGSDPWILAHHPLICKIQTLSRRFEGMELFSLVIVQMPISIVPPSCKQRKVTYADFG